MSVARSGTAVFVSSTLTSVVGFVSILAFARLLPASALGSYFLFEALLALTAIAVNFGLNTATQKRISEGRETATVLSTAATLKLATFVVVAAAILGFGPSVGGYLGESWSGLLVLAVATRESAALAMNALKGEFRMHAFATLRFVRRSTWAATGISGLLLDFGNVSLVYGLLVGEALTLVAAIAVLSVRPVRPSWEAAASLFRYARVNVFSLLGGYVYGWMDTIVLGLFVAPGLVAAYEIAWRVTKVVPTVLGSISETTFPKISEWEANGRLDRAGRVVSQSLVPSVAFAVPGFFGLLVLSEATLTTVFGDAYAVASAALVVLMFSQTLWSVESVFKRALHAVDRPDLPVRSMLAAGLTNLALNVALIPRFGLVGAAVATTLGFGVQTVLDYSYLDSLLPFSLPLSETRWSVLSALGMGASVFAVTRVASVDSFVRLFAVVLFGAGVYFLLLVQHGGLREHIGVWRRQLFPG